MNLEGIDGITFYTNRMDPDLVRVRLNDNATQETVLKLIDQMKDHELSFFDYYYPSPSEPGGYVTVKREGNNFIHKIQNHGWSTEWDEISKERLVEYVYKNRQYNRGVWGEIEFRRLP
jgi:hypothetical protein